MNTNTNTNRANRAPRRTNNRYNRSSFFVITTDTREKVKISTRENNTIQNWLDLKAQQKELEAKMDALKQSVVDVVSEKGGSVQYRGFELTTKVRRSYQFSAEINDLEAELKSMRADDIKNDRAECVRQTEFIEVSKATK